jgi:uncharacterized protein YfaQ (DUF2300 family)
MSSEKRATVRSTPEGTNQIRNQSRQAQSSYDAGPLNTRANFQVPGHPLSRHPNFHDFKASPRRKPTPSGSVLAVRTEAELGQRRPPASPYPSHHDTGRAVAGARAKTTHQRHTIPTVWFGGSPGSHKFPVPGRKDQIGFRHRVRCDNLEAEPETVKQFQA